MLSDAQKRAAYDRFGHPGVGPGPVRGSIRVFRISRIYSTCSVSAICSAAAAATRSTVQRGSDLRYDLEITLEEAATGKEEKLRIPRLEKCEECDGRGAEKGTKAETCITCGGQRPDALPAGLFQRNADLPELPGQGPDHPKPVQEMPWAGTRRERKNA